MNNIYVMKYDTENLGDDIQSVATMDILQDMNIKYSFVYRDLINGYFFNPLLNNKIIFNGWFSNGYGIDHYYNTGDEFKEFINVTWPPTGNFTPILYSFHISEWGPIENREVHPNFLDKSFDFYKSAGAIGCRDTHTCNILQKLNIESYFSGCITLSLDKNKYKKINASKNEVLFVDVPSYYKNKLIEKITSIYDSIEIKSLTHTISPYSVDLLDRTTLAKRHLEAFCNAKLVFTSRLHVALPCLAFGTPVIFVSESEALNNTRFVDYIKYLNVITHDQIDESNLKDFLSCKYNGELSKNVRCKFEEIIKGNI